MDQKDRDWLGRIVRNAWIRWARTQPSPKPSWLVPYEELSEPDKEADRQIGEAVREACDVERLMAENAKLMDRIERMAADRNVVHVLPMTETKIKPTISALRRIAKRLGGSMRYRECEGYEVVAPGGRKWIKAKVNCYPLPLLKCDRSEWAGKIQRAIEMIQAGHEPE